MQTHLHKLSLNRNFNTVLIFNWDLGLEFEKSPVLISQLNLLSLGMQKNKINVKKLFKSKYLLKEKKSKLGILLSGYRAIRQSQEKYIYTRDIWSALLSILSFKNKRVLFDLRGDIIDEYEYRNANSFFIKIFFSKLIIKIILKFIVINSYRCLTVSTFLKDKYLNSDAFIYNSLCDFRPLDKVFVSKDKDKNKINLCYAGSFHKYQNIKEIINFWSRLDANIFNFYIFTNEDISKFNSLDISSHIKSMINFKNLKNHEVENNLDKMDIGFIFRDDIDLNKAASPLKIGEYLRSGLSVAFTGEIGDLTNILSEKNIGINCKGITPESFIFHAKENNINSKKFIHKTAYELFHFEYSVNKICRLI